MFLATRCASQTAPFLNLILGNWDISTIYIYIYIYITFKSIQKYAVEKVIRLSNSEYIVAYFWAPY